MKKHVKVFLNDLEKKTMLKIEFAPSHETTKFLNKYGNPMIVDTMIIDGRMALLVYSCGCNQCKEITGIQIFYGVSSELTDAEDVMLKIKEVVPKIPIVLVDELEMLR